MKILGIAGGSGSGKTTLTKLIQKYFKDKKVGVISQDYYYRDNSHISYKQRLNLNYDHPNAVEFEFMLKQIEELKAGNSVYLPQYSYKKHTRVKKRVLLETPEILITEGILLFHEKAIREAIDKRIFINLREEERLDRIIKRDIVERGRTKEEVAKRFYAEVNPMHNKYVQPTIEYADYIIDGIDMIKQMPHIITNVLNDTGIRN